MADKQKKRKLYELLAIESDLGSIVTKLYDEARELFKKPQSFKAHTQTLRMFADERSQENTAEETAMATTVMAKLKYVQRHVSRYYDAIAAKETSNQIARADLVVDGVTICEDVPTTLLVSLESRLKQLRDVYQAIPTLDSKIDWIADPEYGDGVSRAKNDENRFKTEKQLEFQEVAKATDKHPAQVEKWFVDRPIGNIKVRHWSGCIHPAGKSKYLERIDLLLRAVKTARHRANDTDAVEKPIGQKIFEYINTGK